MVKRKVVSLSDSGYRVGEDHPRARLTNDQVEAARVLNEQNPKLNGYKRLARKFGCSSNTMKDILTFRRRNTYAVLTREEAAERRRRLGSADIFDDAQSINFRAKRDHYE